MIEMTEKIRDQDEAQMPRQEAAEPEAAAGDIEACVGAAGSEEGKAPAIPPVELEQLRSDLVAALKTVFDPEIPVDIYELGLIYRLDVDDDRNIEVDMTLTAPGCPVAGDMPGWVENALSSVPGVGQVKVNLVFDPPWDMSRMSDEARFALNMF
jgi:FeS assembly SUF system protein